MLRDDRHPRGVHEATVDAAKRERSTQWAHCTRDDRWFRGCRTRLVTRGAATPLVHFVAREAPW